MCDNCACDKRLRLLQHAHLPASVVGYDAYRRTLSRWRLTRQTRLVGLRPSATHTRNSVHAGNRFVQALETLCGSAIQYMTRLGPPPHSYAAVTTERLAAHPFLVRCKATRHPDTVEKPPHILAALGRQSLWTLRAGNGGSSLRARRAGARSEAQAVACLIFQ